MNAPTHTLFALALAALWCGFALFGLLHALARSPHVRSLLARFRTSGPLVQSGAFALLLAAVAIGGTKPGSGGNGGGGGGLRSVPPAPPPEPAFGLVEVRTQGVAMRAEPTNAVEAAAWRLRGASEDGIWIERESPFFALGTNPVRRVHASASGTISFDSSRRPPLGAALPDGTFLPALVPFRAPLGILPAAAETNAEPSRFWHAPAPGGGLLLTWDSVLVDRLPERRATVQAELRPNGDFTCRYDFAEALDPPPTNFVIGAQAGTNGVNALAILGTNLLSAPVWRVNGGASPLGEPQFVADLLCTNGALRTPARFALEWRNTTGLEPADDTDEDGVSDWDEIFRHGTDPRQSDTDGDGLSDGAEILSGADPRDADENGDGVPDGADPADWAANPLWAGNETSKRSIVISPRGPLSSPATHVIGDLSIPLREDGCWTISLERGVLYPFRLFTGGECIRLSISPTNDTASLRAHATPPLRSESANEDDGFWLEDPTDAFGAGSNGGDGRMAFPEIILSPAPGEQTRGNHLVGNGEMCVHSQDRIARWEWSLLPDVGGDPLVSTPGLVLVGRFIALRIPTG